METPWQRGPVSSAFCTNVLLQEIFKAYDHKRFSQRKEGNRSGVGAGGGRVREIPTLLKKLYTSSIGSGKLEHGPKWVTVRSKTPSKDTESH